MFGFMECVTFNHRHCLWIVGNAATLEKSDSVWTALIRNAKKRGCYFDAVQNQNLSRAILKIQKEQDQIDALLAADPGMLIQSAKWKVIWLVIYVRMHECLVLILSIER